ncbi:MAG: hypothetical protein PUP92_24655 [Rhizonema sp. PD38]|nr:hypothetical protein [Rhizonema sp. PD38]
MRYSFTGFLGIGDWIASYREQLINILKPPKNRQPPTALSDVHCKM